MKKPETKYLAKLRRALIKEFGGYWYKNWGGLFTEVGLPDLTGIVGGIYIGVEAKVGKNKTSAIQKEVLRKIRANGGVGVTSYDIPSTIRRIRKALEVSKGLRIVYVKTKRKFPSNGNWNGKDTHDISESRLPSSYRKRG